MSLRDQMFDFLATRATAYRRVFAGPNADVVLRDLAKFCRAGKSTFHPDPHIAARLDGRREVWLRVQDHVHLSNDQLMKLYGGTDG